MLGGSFFVWWYGLGWTRLMHEVWARIVRVLQFFSVGLLLGSLFAPFRQISAGATQGSLQKRLAAFGDLLFSRAIGAVVRLLIIFIGLICTLITCIIGLAAIIVWPFLPVAPLIGLFLMQVGVTP